MSATRGRADGRVERSSASTSCWVDAAGAPALVPVAAPRARRRRPGAADPAGRAPSRTAAPGSDRPGAGSAPSRSPAPLGRPAPDARAGRGDRGPGRAAARRRRRRLGQDRDDGRPGGLAGRQRARRARGGARPDLHPQGRRRARRPGAVAGCGRCTGSRRSATSPAASAVTVSTYHAYAAAVLADHGLRLGVEPGAQLLGEAGAWQLAAEVVERWDGDMSGVDRTPRHGHRGRARRSPASAPSTSSTRPTSTAFARAASLERVEQLPAVVGDAGPGAPNGAGAGAARHGSSAARRLVPLVERVRPSASASWRCSTSATRSRWPPGSRARCPRSARASGSGSGWCCSTSTRTPATPSSCCCAALFGGGHPVTAVGDPHQSIYGWRGASAGNLQRFPRDFPRRGPTGASPAATRVPVDELAQRRRRARRRQPGRRRRCARRPPWVRRRAASRRRPGAAGRARAPGPARSLVGWHATARGRGRAVADVVEARWRAGRPRRDAGADAPTAAVLCRTRAQFPLVEAALRARGLPVEVVGPGRPAARARGRRRCAPRWRCCTTRPAATR